MRSDNYLTLGETFEIVPGRAEPTRISGFWRRVFALIIDGIILGAGGFVLGLLLFDFFVELGGWGRLVGFFMALLYFGILNSLIGKGQTIGKRVTKVKVVDGNGNEISLMRSFARYLILAPPFFLNGALIPPSIAMLPLSFLVGLIVFGGSGGIIYLYVFNRRTRQSLHDLVVGTYVVRSPAAVKFEAPKIWPGHLVILGMLFLAVVLFTTVIAPWLSQRRPYQELLSVQESIQRSGNVQAATVQIGKSWGPHGETRYLKVNAIWRGRPENYKKAAAKIASIVLKEYPHIMDQDFLLVTVTHGYDIGIARAWRAYHARHSPNEWKEKLGQSYSAQ